MDTVTDGMMVRTEIVGVPAAGETDVNEKQDLEN